MLPNEAPSESGRHFAQGEFPGFGSVQYGTNPPTSGRHIGQLAAAGISDQVVPNEILVHNMEHGYVIVWYNCNAGTPLTGEECTALRNELGQVVSVAAGQNKHVVMTPSNEIEHRIALTAWQFLDQFDEFDQQRVETFIDTFNCHYDPEGGCV